MSGYIKCFDETKYISSLIKDRKLLKGYDTIWDIISWNVYKLDLVVENSIMKNVWKLKLDLITVK